MAIKFRASEFIDFNTGHVIIAPIQLQFRMKLAGAVAFADLLRLFECRVEVWHLGVLAQMVNNIEYGQPPSIWSHAAYGLLPLLFIYFETVGKMLAPAETRDEPPEIEFNRGFHDVYNDVTTSSGERYDPQEFYRRGQNELFLLGSTPHGLWVHNNRSISTKDFDIVQSTPINPATRKYYVNPHTTARTVINHFPTLIARLNDPDAQYNPLRARFREIIGNARDDES